MPQGEWQRVPEVGDATTMHMALGLFGDGDYEALIDELSADFINVDEVSMVDMHLAYEFFLQGKSRSQSAFWSEMSTSFLL